VQASLPSGGYTFHNFIFSYDKVGNLTQLQNQVQPPPTHSIGGPETKTFVYDDLYRLTSSTGCHDTSTTCLNNPPTGMFTYSFSQSYNSIHNITHKTQTALQSSATNPQTTYDFTYTYPAPGAAHPHSPTAIGPFTITNDADGNQVNTLGTGTSDQSEYVYDEENRLSCANKGPQVPTPACNAQGNTSFIYDHDGTRKVKTQSSPVIYPNQFYTDFGGGAGNQFKHIFIGSERILTKKARVAPDRQHWYYHPDHLGSTSMVTNETSALVDALHYFPFGEVWLEEVPASLPADYFFTAKEFDPETGFYDFGSRYLDPRFSKWMTADPALGGFLPSAGKAVAYQSPALTNKWRGYPDLPGMGGAFQSKNLALYSYGHHNPGTLFDPNGMEVREGNDEDYPSLYNTSNGIKAHNLAFEYLEEQYPNRFVFDSPLKSIFNNAIFGRGEPDVLDKRIRLIWELKPITWVNRPWKLQQAQNQVQGYLDDLRTGGKDFDRGDSRDIIPYIKGEGLYIGQIRDQDNNAINVYLWPQKNTTTEHSLFFYKLVRTELKQETTYERITREIGDESMKMLKHPPWWIFIPGPGGRGGRIPQFR
jgi:RHS repeat-associated protein